MQAKKSRLEMVKRQVIQAGNRFCFYGPESVGKSTLAAHAPSPIFFDTEDGSGKLNVARYSFHDGPRNHVPQTLEQFMDGVQDLLGNEHIYKTLVIDTLDRLEHLIWDYCLRRDSRNSTPLNPKGKPITSIEGYGYGKGYQVALDEWRRVCARLDELRARKVMDIVLIGHAAVKRYANPAGEDWDRYQLRLQDSDRVSAAGFMKEWCDVVGFVCFEEGAREENDGPRAKGYSTGRRFIRLERTAAYDAKSRIPVPPQVQLGLEDPWAPFADAVQQGLTLDAGALKILIDTELVRIGDAELETKVDKAVEAAGGNVALLGRYLNELRRRDPKEKN